MVSSAASGRRYHSRVGRRRTSLRRGGSAIAKFDERYLRSALAELERSGTELGPGLDPQALERAEAAFGCRFPPELRLLLQTAVPQGDRWVDWRRDPVEIAEAADAHIVGAFEFDILGGKYWCDAFGPRPDDLEEAVDTAVAVVRTWPRLIPVFAHRFLPSRPEEPGNPVLSVWQPVDSIVYGNDLADYLHREFGISRPDWAREAPREVPFWSQALEL